MPTITSRSISLRGSFSREVAEAAQIGAFTVIELLVVLAILAFIVCLFATARAASRPNLQGALCLNNLRQMMDAFTMYTHDHSDVFPPNGVLTPNPGCNWVSGNVSGWLPFGTVGSVDAG